MTGIYVVTLRKDEPSPFAPRSDEGAVSYPPQPASPPGATAGGPGSSRRAARTQKHAGKTRGDDAAAEEWKPSATAPIRIDLDGLMQRAVPLPIPAANIAAISVRGDNVFYMTSRSQMIDGAAARARRRRCTSTTWASARTRRSLDGPERLCAVRRRQEGDVRAQERLLHRRCGAGRGGREEPQAARPRAHARAHRAAAGMGGDVRQSPGGSSATSSSIRR